MKSKSYQFAFQTLMGDTWTPREIKRAPLIYVSPINTAPRPEEQISPIRRKTCGAGTHLRLPPASECEETASLAVVSWEKGSFFLFLVTLTEFSATHHGDVTSFYLKKVVQCTCSRHIPTTDVVALDNNDE